MQQDGKNPKFANLTKNMQFIMDEKSSRLQNRKINPFIFIILPCTIIFSMI